MLVTRLMRSRAAQSAAERRREIIQSTFLVTGDDHFLRLRTRWGNAEFSIWLQVLDRTSGPPHLFCQR